MPERSADYGGWGVVEAGAPPHAPLEWTNEETTLSLPPGSYDVYWVQDYDNRGNPLLLAAGVAVAAGSVVTVAADSGVVLEVGDWVPGRNPDYGWWGAVTAGDPPDALLNWTREADALLLPPGSYDVYWVQDYDNRGNPLLLASGVEIEVGVPTVVKADSGVVLDLAPWVPPPDPDHGWWGAVFAGKPPHERVHWTRHAEAMLLPPGLYDIYWVQDYEHRANPLLLEAALEVEAEGFGGVGIVIRMEAAPAWMATPGGEDRPSSGAQEVVAVVGVQEGSPAAQAGIATGDIIVAIAGDPVAGLLLDEVVARIRGTAGASVMLTVMREGAAQPIKATVTRETRSPISVVDVNAGIRANVTVGAHSLDADDGWWVAVPAGTESADRVNWSTGSAIDPLLLAPGIYDVYWRPDGRTEPQLAAGAVELHSGTLMLVTVGAEPGVPAVALSTLAQAPVDAAMASVFTAFGVGSAEAPNAGIVLPEGVRQVQARYDWRGAEVGQPLGVRWYKDGELILQEGEEAGGARGTTTWILRMETEEPLPAGTYRVEAVSDGKPGPTLPFIVGAAGSSFLDRFGPSE